MIIDTHAHIYSEDLETYPTIDDPLRPPPGAGTPEGLREAMRSTGVDRAMLVQTSTFYRMGQHLCARRRRGLPDDWARSVVTLDPEDPHSPDVLFALYERANARALRTYPVGHRGLRPPRQPSIDRRRLLLGHDCERPAWASCGQPTNSP